MNAFEEWSAVEVGDTGALQGIPSAPVFDIVGPDRKVICTVQFESRARLIAAAPQLADMLRTAVTCKVDRNGYWRAEAEALLRSIEGKKP